MAFVPAKRLNVVTGDNGLGKSFLLDLAWWAVTRTWAGQPIRPPVDSAQGAHVEIEFAAKTRMAQLRAIYDRSEQDWRFPKGQPGQPGLVVYARVDGDFAVWDSSRRFGDRDEQESGVPKGLLFSREAVWDGLHLQHKPICNGLLADWVTWQQTGAWEFEALTMALEVLSPSEDEVVRIGQPARTEILDSRLIPTLSMPYGQDVPVTVASAGMKRVIALAYLLVWAWREHLTVSRLAGRLPAERMLVIIDEVESHLHPKWQRVILSALVQSLSTLTQGEAPKIQYIVATHSPLVLASIEQLFEPRNDALFELQLEGQEPHRHVELRKAPFHKFGSAERWLHSDAFGVTFTGSLQAEEVLARAAALMQQQGAVSKQAMDAMEREIASVLSEFDPFWVRWRAARSGFKSLA